MVVGPLPVFLPLIFVPAPLGGPTLCALLTVWLGLLCLEPRWGDFFAANWRIVMEADEEHRPNGTNRRSSTPGEKQWLTI